MRPKLLVAGIVLVLVSVVPGVAWADTSITTSNTSENVDAESGDATVVNNLDTSVGQSTEGEGENTQLGDTTSDDTQDATTNTGAAISGQVVGGVAETGDLLINATNLAEDSTAFTGDSNADNNADILVGLVGEGANFSGGEIDSSLGQDANSVSGDAVGGQYIGAQANNGRADLVLANTTNNVDTGSGEADENNTGALETGEFIFTIEL